MILSGFIAYLVQEICKLASVKLQSKRTQANLLIRKWGLNGLGTVYISWTVLLFLSWVVLTMNFAMQHGYATADGILAFGGTTFAMVVSLGLPALALNRLARRADPKHWVVRMTASLSPQNQLERRSTSSRDKFSYVQVLPAVVRRDAQSQKGSST